MELSRIFLSQEALDEWLTDERVDIAQNEMTVLGVGARFSLKTALRFVDEVAGGGDEASLVGKVQDLEQLASLGGEHCADSVVLGDNAYQVVEGFVAEFIPESDLDAEATQVDGADESLKALVARLLAR